MPGVVASTRLILAVPLLVGLTVGSSGCGKAPSQAAAAASPAKSAVLRAAPQSPVVRGVGAAAPPEGRVKVVVDRASFTDAQLTMLFRPFPQVDFAVVEGDAEMTAALADAQVLMTTRLTQEIIAGARELEWIQHYAAGLDDAVLSELVASPVVLTNAKIVQGPEVADHGMALLLALTRRLPLTLRDQSERRWDTQSYRDPLRLPEELQGKTATIVGMGGTGTQLAQRCHAFGMRVVGVDARDVPLSFFVQEVHKPDALRDLLPETDVLFVAAPLSEETRGLIDASALSSLRKGAYVIALSHGGIVDCDALAEALASGHLAGAGLDVTKPEPLPAGHPLWSMPNVVLTPHMAGQSEAGWDRRAQLLQENLQRYLDGRPLRNVVDKKLGY